MAPRSKSFDASIAAKRAAARGAEHMAAMLAANFAAMCGGSSSERPAAANTAFEGATRPRAGARQRVGDRVTPSAKKSHLRYGPYRSVRLNSLTLIFPLPLSYA